MADPQEDSTPVVREWRKAAGLTSARYCPSSRAQDNRTPCDGTEGLPHQAGRRSGARFSDACVSARSRSSAARGTSKRRPILITGSWPLATAW